MDDRQQDELTPMEIEALAALPREQSPPPYLEDQVVRKLQARGLVRRGGHVHSQPTSGAKLVWLAVAMAASVVLFAAGFAIGRRDAHVSTRSGYRFILLLYEDTTFSKDTPAETTLVQEYRQWAGSLRRDRRLISAEKPSFVQ